MKSLGIVSLAGDLVYELNDEERRQLPHRYRESSEWYAAYQPPGDLDPELLDDLEWVPEAPDFGALRERSPSLEEYRWRLIDRRVVTRAKLLEVLGLAESLAREAGSMPDVEKKLRSARRSVDLFARY